MPVYTHWDNAEKTILIVEYNGVWTWDELFSARAQMNREFDTLENSKRIHIIHDWANSAALPPDVLSQSKKLMGVLHPKVGVQVFIGFSPIFLSLFQVFRRFYNPVAAADFIYAHHLDEARLLVTAIIQRDAASSGDS